MSGVEIGILFVLALLLLGPNKLPELARGLGKGIR
ncbi:MAG: twin-arginine translocase TatA/TatE family subunit, partial [Myxococcales bacterium]